MKPYIHHIYQITESGEPGKLINTIRTKKKFHAWALDYILRTQERIIFRLDTWPDDLFMEPVLCPKMRGKNAGELRIVFTEVRKKSADYSSADYHDEKIPF
ncbi:hypothetical protein [Desulfatibacillum aliphaticivorans]|uniref:hypothetical protein n=1 Tax=Desulfatibacillum aliphaticivorans TaxID=218208 RepID=UPI00042A2B68|nr:hypothetical protein [Desulfatibacillum aliphaticivorans]